MTRLPQLALRPPTHKNSLPNIAARKKNILLVHKDERKKPFFFGGRLPSYKKCRNNEGNLIDVDLRLLQKRNELRRVLIGLLTKRFSLLSSCPHVYFIHCSYLQCSLQQRRPNYGCSHRSLMKATKLFLCGGSFVIAVLFRDESLTIWSGLRVYLWFSSSYKFRHGA